MVLIPPGANPATYELSPSQMQKIDRAVAYFKVGSGLPFEEIWLDKISKLNPKMKIIDCSKNIEIMSGAADAHATEGAHGQDPHIWLSPRNAKIMVSNIAKGMAEVDSGNATTYEKNASVYQTKLDQLDITIRNEFEGITNRNFLIYHPAWGYFARDYDLNQIPIEIEGKEPRAADLTALVKLAKEKNLQTVFASPEFNTESARTIAKEIGGKVELIDPLAKDYGSNLTSVAIKLAQSMK
jgi:zinc transport system substrate-binding protein